MSFGESLLICAIGLCQMPIIVQGGIYHSRYMIVPFDFVIPMLSVAIDFIKHRA